MLLEESPEERLVFNPVPFSALKGCLGKRQPDGQPGAEGGEERGDNFLIFMLSKNTLLDLLQCVPINFWRGNGKL